MRVARLSASLVIVVAFGFLLWAGAYAYMHTPVHTPGQPIEITIESGWSFARISQTLAEKGVIQSSWKFRLLAHYKQQTGAVQAGEFRLHSGWTPVKILDALVSGRAVLHTFPVPEGLPWWDVATLAGNTPLTSREKFEAALRDSEFLATWDIPTEHAEGFLFPETYHVHRSASQDPYPLLRAMFSQFWHIARTQLWPQGLPETEEIVRTVTLASLVEKETGRADERRAVAGVFANRLERGMRLQCDPTIIYGIGPDFDGNLQRTDLQNATNPYNTYQHSGLPPGPICSPGLGALRAALNPEDHDYLYFVATKEGGHHFSRTLREHNRAVRRYQLGR
ncbi:MAG: endolytic transglycosylase MltG [Thermodesulfobacteriota bacterium]